MWTEHGTKWAMLLALVACVGACGAPDAGARDVFSASGEPDGMQPPAQPEPDRDACGLAGTVRDCDCGQATAGKQTCTQGGWGACACGADPAHTAAGAAGASGAAADASPRPAVADEPPPGVEFQWAERDPSQRVECEPGHYVGTFSCDLFIVTNDGMPAFELNGTIDMQLEQTMDGELLRIADGTFVSAAAVAIPAWGDIVGELDCSRGRFDGQIQNGRFSVALGLPIPFTEGIFEGDLSADYDAATASMNDGVWDMIGNLDGFPGSCAGTWSAMRAP